MKKVKVAVALVLAMALVLALCGCVYVRIGDGKMVKGSGNVETRDFALDSALTGLDNQSSLEVIIDPSLEGKAVIEGDDNLLDYVKLEQDSAGTLVVDVEPDVSISPLKYLTVRIPAVNGGSIAVNGSGSITQENGTLKGSSFEVIINGSGSLGLILDAPSLNVDATGSGSAYVSTVSDSAVISMDGSGSVILDGSAQTLDAKVTGSGSLESFGFAVQDAQVSVSGSGSANVNAAGSLTGDIGGSGSIIYDGDPASVEVADNGSGSAAAR